MFLCGPVEVVGGAARGVGDAGAGQWEWQRQWLWLWYL
jgi:hypothetical protein